MGVADPAARGDPVEAGQAALHPAADGSMVALVLAVVDVSAATGFVRALSRR
ncbi:hypothetical protein ACFQS1_30860 [Paractinoplanes rhizophilus]|uniref:Uncharacterized protein n=1 Tax=Paractinoplanes rhizophilus TaxID=1416877 RepID=A0ABW2I1A3_9ACTN|nr:hypothetical protein [Actinoplanes sp.]